MSSVSSEQLAGSRPGIMRWISAFLISAIVSPVFAPYLWALFVVEGVDSSSMVLGLVFTYAIGLPFVIVGNIIQVLLALTLFRLFQKWSDFQWGLVGAFFGLVILGVLLMITGADLNILFLASGGTVGFVAAYLFHAVLTS